MRRAPASFAKLLLNWYSTEARDLPWRLTSDPYAIWVSEVMLQQTRVKTVIPYWKRWMKRFPTVERLAAANEMDVLKHWEGLGYYRRARNLHNGAAHIVTELNGHFPQTHAKVLQLPGVGPYTAGAICSIAFNQPTPIVDGNVIRVLTRLHAIEQNPKDTATHTRIWDLAEDLVSSAARVKSPDVPRCSFLNQSLMELGALICTPTQPACTRCPLNRLCDARKRGLTDRIPALPERRKTIRQRHAALVIRFGTGVVLRLTGTTRHNAGLWEFPSFEWTAETAIEDAINQAVGAKPPHIEAHSIIRQTITHHRIELHVIKATFRSKKPFVKSPYAITPLDELQTCPMSSAHRKIARQLQSD